MKNFTALVCLGFPAVTPAIAGRTETKNMDRANMDGATNVQDRAATKAFDGAIYKMDAATKAAPCTGNADVDFVNKMIRHYHGAVNMAKVELQYVKNPKIRKLAENIIKSQSHQIVEMDAWLATHGSPPAN
jgi:uncharacterized protein (DUF305 family)